MKRRARASNQLGFTLIEVLAAFVVIAMLLALGGNSFRLIGRSSELGVASANRMEMLSRGMAIVRHDVARMERLPGSSETGRARAEFSGEADKLSFVVVEPPFPTEAGLHRVTYSIQRRGADAELLRTRALFHVDDRRRTVRVLEEPVAVVTGPYRFRFSYPTEAANGPAWSPKWQDPNRTPSMVRLEVLSDSGRATIPPLIIKLRQDAPVASITQVKRQ